MATVSLSPSPAPILAMSSRRVPLGSNPNVVNSPLRGPSTLAGHAKQKRSFANIQREEPYGQPPPVKKQALDNGGQRAVRSPLSSRAAAAASRPLVQRGAVSVVAAAAASARLSTATVSKERVSRAPAARPAAARTARDVDNEKEVWKKHYRAKFPKMVFYFESIPDDVRAKLTKRVTYFGARQEPFFSIEVTHVITTRAIPPERVETAAEGRGAGADGEPEEAPPPQQQQQQPQQQQQQPQQQQQQPQQQQQMQPQQVAGGQQPQTINPSLLDRNTAARRKLLFDFRPAPPAPSNKQLDDAAIRRTKTRNNDVLHKARDMGKKIWSLEKFQTMLSVLLESESHGNGSNASRSLSMRGPYGASKNPHAPSLLQLLHNERINGPSDRDPTAVSRELVYFKGPYIYVWDMDEKQKPVMVREYAKVADKADGEWPQFRSVGNGRCPFVEETEASERDPRRSREREKARAAAAAAATANKREDAVPVLRPPVVPPARALAGKRTLAEMEDGHNRAARGVTPTTDALHPARAGVVAKQAAEMRPTQNAFTSRAEGARLLAGEPVASGMQPSNITSAIRSQMMSSTSGVNGAKAGTSKEIHGLQRKVLQRAATPASHQQDASSRRLAEVSMEAASSRSATMSRHTSKTLQAQDDDSHRTGGAPAAEDRERRSARALLKSKRDLKPGYCENCQDKFQDFDEHIASRKHRKFAENDENWADLDCLLAQLKDTDDESW